MFLGRQPENSWEHRENMQTISAPCQKLDKNPTGTLRLLGNNAVTTAAHFYRWAKQSIKYRNVLTVYQENGTANFRLAILIEKV